MTTTIDGYINEVGELHNIIEMRKDKVIMKCSSIMNIAMLVAASDSVAIAPKNLIKEISELIDIKYVVADFIPEGNSWIYAYIHKTQAKNPILLNFLQQVKATLA
ncbi:MAG TPA: hypothetical protein VGI71_11620 [Scandinavium sp.]